jgi:hypothetical protein
LSLQAECTSREWAQAFIHGGESPELRYRQGQGGCARQEERQRKIRSFNSKVAPAVLLKIRKVESADFAFLADGKSAEHSLYLGCLRSGSNRLKETEITIDGPDALTHHVLITATTGRGKSNLVKAMLWKLLEKEYCGILVLDPHDEYFGNSAAPGMRDHPKAKEKIVYYSPSAAAPKGS